MKLKKILVIIAIALGSNLSPAQIMSSGIAAYYNKTIRESVQFSITVSNKVMVIGSTNLVHCRVQNISSNRIVFYNNTYSAVLLTTNNESRLEKNTWFFSTEQPNASESRFLDAEKEYEWDEQVIIGNDIKAGHYGFGIRKFFSIPTSGVQYTIDSRLQDIEFTK